MKLRLNLRFPILTCLSSLFLLASCGQDDDPVAATKLTRTVLVYIMGDNTLSSLVAADVEQMVEGMSTVDASAYNLLVYVDDKTSSYPTLYYLSKDGDGNVQKEAIKEYKEQISTDTSVMTEVMNRAFTEYPAESYGLVFWSHGEGWMYAESTTTTSTRWIGQDTTDGTSYLNISDMASVLAAMPHFDFILFDACFGQAIEVAYELRDYADYIIGSPTEIPGPGAPYDTVVPAMFSTSDVGVAIGKAYYEYYAAKYTGVSGSGSNTNWTYGTSISVIACSALDNLASVTKNLLSSMPTYELADLRTEVYDYDKRTSRPSAYVGYFDMRQIMENLSLYTDEYVSALNSAIVYWQTTAKNYSSYGGLFSIPQDETCGVTHYIPQARDSSVLEDYHAMAWYTAAGLSQLGW